MECSGRLTGITKNFATGKYNLVFEIDGKNISEVESLAKKEKLNISAVPYKKIRSTNANALMWLLLQRIADYLGCDKWEVYLKMLKRYGRFTYVCIKPEAVDSLKREWRACEEIGELMIGDQKAVQMLCYFGSHTYDTKEFSYLLNGIISEMREMGIPVPNDEDVNESLKELESAKHNSERKEMPRMRNSA